MNTNLFFEIILILFAILASNGIIFILLILNLNKNLNKKNSSENISVITNNSEKDGLALTSIIASNPINITSSESSSSQTLSVTSSETNVSQDILNNLNGIDSEMDVSQDILDNLNGIDSETNVSQDILNNINGIDSETNESQDILNNINEEIFFPYLDGSGNITSLESRTILDNQSYEQWASLVSELHQHPINTPPGVLQQIKFEELNILYSQDLIHFSITQTELRLIIEHLPATSLFDPEINHLILTMMSYYH